MAEKREDTRRRHCERTDYDARGAMTHLEDYAGNDYYFEYDAVGWRTVKQLPNGALSYFGYDSASRQTSILNVESDMTPISATYYEWNEDGLPTRQRRRGDYDVDHEYVYDDVPRQIGENIKEPDGTLLHGFQYWYDEAGQRIRKSVYPDQLTYYEFNAANQLVTSQHYDGSRAYFSYDADGNTASIECPSGGDAGPQGTTHYTWNQDNLMVEAAVPGVATTNEFEWNAAQQRTKKTDSDSTAHLLRDGRHSRFSVPPAPRAQRTRARSPRVVGLGLADVSRGATVWPTYDMLGRHSRFPVPPAPPSLQGGARSPRAVGLGLADVSRGGPFGYVGALGYYNDADLAMPLLSIRHYAMPRGMFVASDPVLTEPRYGYVHGLPGWGMDAAGLRPSGADMVDTYRRMMRCLTRCETVALPKKAACRSRCLERYSAATGYLPPDWRVRLGLEWPEPPACCPAEWRSWVNDCKNRRSSCYDDIYARGGFQDLCHDACNGTGTWQSVIGFLGGAGMSYGSIIEVPPSGPGSVAAGNCLTRAWWGAGGGGSQLVGTGVAGATYMAILGALAILIVGIGSYAVCKSRCDQLSSLMHVECSERFRMCLCYGSVRLA